ncbi:MAG TPA: hypothetical protein VI756_25410 [Blastocatellia bacterium]
MSLAIEHISWALPAAKEAYKNREEIAGAWDKITALLFGKKKSIAFTGMAGVGKTVSFEHLTGKAYKQGYSPPPTSQAREGGKVSFQKKRIHITVIPGQDSPPRLEAVDEVFFGKKGVDGIIHVVSNGFVELRDPVAKQVLVDNGLDTSEKYRQHQLGEELRSLDSTCELVRQAIRRHRKPRWMLVAVSKADLFYETITTVRQFYSPFGQSRFSDRLKQLRAQVGADNFQWDAAPTCAWLEDFDWNGEKVHSILKPNERDHFLGAFAKLLETYCEQ